MLVMSAIVKRFGSAVALDGVDVTFRAGNVHGVLGENGAGKTTLMRIAAGLLRPDEGTLRADGRMLPTGSPAESARAGVAMVHQHFMLVPTLTVAENFIIGRPDLLGRAASSGTPTAGRTHRRQWFSRRRLAERILALSNRSGLQVDPYARVDALSVGERQRVEILRALSLVWGRLDDRDDRPDDPVDVQPSDRAAGVLILDEPTAVLTPQEADQLFASIARLRRGGLSIVFISHKLNEVEQICDELTILRQGRCVYSGAAANLSQERMAELMVGPSVAASIAGGLSHAHAKQRRSSRAAASLLEIANLRVLDPVSARRLEDINLTVHAGEILGIAGVEGNGQDLLAATIIGVRRTVAGRLTMHGIDVTRQSVRARFRTGLAHVPEDRLVQALVPALSLRENLILKDYASPAFARAGLIRWGRVTAHAAERLTCFDVRGGTPGSQAGLLSGGNQQKLVLAREFHIPVEAPSSQAGSQRVHPSRIIVAHNPVRGLDVAATRFVFQQLLDQRDAGAAILLIHSDLDELLELSDRVMVMFRGRCLPTDWPACDRTAIGRMMMVGEARHEAQPMLQETASR